MACPLLALCALSATRPHYGGTLHVELRDAVQTADPPQSGPGIADLFAAFTITRWEGGHRAAFAADENAAGGRPFLDSVEIDMGRAAREQIGRPQPRQVPTSSNSASANCRACRMAAGSGPRRPCAWWRWSSNRAWMTRACAKPWRFPSIATPFTACCCSGRARSRAPCSPSGSPGSPFYFPSAADLNRARALSGGVAAVRARALSGGGRPRRSAASPTASP